MSVRYAICLGFRNWHVDHLTRCLRSLPKVPVVLCDLGSDGDVFDRVQDVWALCVGDGALVRRAKAEWSRSIALNTAARASRALIPHLTHYVFTDADMIFPTWWAEAAESCMGFHPETLWLTPSRDLSPEAVEMKTDVDLFYHSTEHDTSVGQGAAMVVPAAWFDAVGGFDEFYQVWGAEDNDLVFRAQWADVPVRHLPTWVAHQPHPRDWPTPAQWLQVEANRVYLADRVQEAKQGQPTIVRNRA